jgi:hypothetical protein
MMRKMNEFQILDQVSPSKNFFSLRQQRLRNKLDRFPYKIFNIIRYLQTKQNHYLIVSFYCQACKITSMY